MQASLRSSNYQHYYDYAQPNDDQNTLVSSQLHQRLTAKYEHQQHHAQLSSQIQEQESSSFYQVTGASQSTDYSQHFVASSSYQILYPNQIISDDNDNNNNNNNNSTSEERSATHLEPLKSFEPPQAQSQEPQHSAYQQNLYYDPQNERLWINSDENNHPTAGQQQQQPINNEVSLVQFVEQNQDQHVRQDVHQPHQHQQAHQICYCPEDIYSSQTTTATTIHHIPCQPEDPASKLTQDSCQIQYYDSNNQGPQVYQPLQVVSSHQTILASEQSAESHGITNLLEAEQQHQQVVHYANQQTPAIDLTEIQETNLSSGNHYYLNSEASFSSAASPASSSSSTNEESSSISSTLTRDEVRAKEANIPMTYFEIVNSSIEQFNDFLSSHQLTETQLTLIKDIRRRGKNKVAAQSCRKRKMDQIYDLQREVNDLVTKRKTLASQCGQLAKEHDNLVREYDRINAIIRYNMQ